MAVHGELRPDDGSLPLLVASAALAKADSAMTRPTGSVKIDNADGSQTWLGEAGSVDGGIAQWVGDTTPPAKPTGVTAECVAGTIVVSWDGTLAEPVPPDFSHVEIFARKDGDTVTVDVDGKRRTRWYDVQVRVHKDFRLEMHVDTDDANAVGIGNGAKVKIVKE